MNKEKILVVEDEADILELIEYNLTREGYRVLGVPTMASITEAIQKEVPSKAKENMKAAEEAYKKVKFLESIDGGQTKQPEIRSEG